MNQLNKYCVPALLLIFILKVYGSLILSRLGLISDATWCYIHFVGMCILLCSFFHLLKDRMNAFVYSLGISIFISRLITQIFYKGLEYWYEMVSIIVITNVIYLVKKWHSQK